MTIEMPVAIPGMKVTVQGPISPDGQQLAFEMPVDAMLSTNQVALDARLDVLTAALRRQRAIEELPLTKQSLHINRGLLITAREEQAKAVARSLGNVVRLSQNRRREADPLPGDVNAISQYDQRILQIEGQIKQAEARIPYLEAIIAHEDPPDPWAANDTAMAAE